MEPKNYGGLFVDVSSFPFRGIFRFHVSLRGCYFKLAAAWKGVVLELAGSTIQ